MFSGAWVPDLHGTSHSADHTYHVDPRAMIITPHNEDLAKFVPSFETFPLHSHGGPYIEQVHRL